MKPLLDAAVILFGILTFFLAIGMFLWRFFAIGSTNPATALEVAYIEETFFWVGGTLLALIFIRTAINIINFIWNEK